MRLDRRNILAGAGLLAAGLAPNAAAAEPARTPPSPLTERLAAAATASRLRLDFTGGRFSGPAWDFMLAEGAAAQFFLLGEEHGVEQIPALSRDLMLALKPAGYEHLAIEISPPVARELDRAAVAGLDGIRRFNADYPPGPAFYFMKPEAEFLAAVRQAFPASRQLLWGLDYEVIQDRRLIARLQARAPASAQAAVQALADASARLWAQYAETRNPRFIFSFAGDPALVAAVRNAWPRPDAASDEILDVLQATLEANALWVAGKDWESNDRRTRLMRASFARYWRAERAQGRTPKVFFKFGASHMSRGRDMSEVYDLGDIAAEAAALEGKSSFHLFVAPPRTERHAQFNPATMNVMPVPASYFDEQGVGFLADVAYPDAFTLINLRPLRPLLGARNWQFDARVARVIHGFDAMLVLPGATPSTML